MHVKRLIDLLNKDEGSGLILALMTLMVLSVLGASLGAITFGSYKLGDVNRDDNSAYYIAEAGANIAYEELEKGVLAVYEESEEGDFFDKVTSLTEEVADKINVNEGDTYYDFETQFGDDPTATIAINEVEGSNPVTYEIVSTGAVAGKSRSVTKSVEINWTKKTVVEQFPNIPDSTAVIVQKSLDFSNGEIRGNVHIDALKAPDGIKISPHLLVDGIVYLHPDVENHNTVIQGPKDLTTINREHSLNFNKYIDYVESNAFIRGPTNDTKKEIIRFPSNTSNEYQISEPRIIDIPNLDNNHITFNLQRSDVWIIADELVLNRSNLETKGEGTLNIYVKSNFKFNGGGSNILSKENTKINIYYEGSERLEISNQNKIIANIFSKNSEILIGGGSPVEGYIISASEKNVSLGNYGQMKLNLIAPKAKIELNGSGTVNGIIIGRELTVSNSGKLYASNTRFEDFPFGSLGSNGGSGSGASLEDIISSKPAIE